MLRSAGWRAPPLPPPCVPGAFTAQRSQEAGEQARRYVYHELAMTHCIELFNHSDSLMCASAVWAPPVLPTIRGVPAVKTNQWQAMLHQHKMKQGLLYV